MNDLSGKVIMVTGASKGIGKEIAISLASKGASLVVNYNKDEQGAKEVVELIKANGGYAVACQGDVGKYVEAERLIEFTIKTFGKLDVLVNNAGISSIGLLMDISEKEINKLIDTNIKGVIYTSKLAIPHFLSKGKGNIVNISSIWGKSGAACEVVYSATKGAINSFTKALAKELAPSSIRVNGVAPGVINTAMNKWLSEDEAAELTEEIPMGRFGEGSEVAEVVSFLCSEQSSYVTGQVITVDGGMI
ncbi:elongation factor P 5-aminopentanone reductase [Clostridium manihotivorum]|uniref:Short-chain dehydrogenase n=1 Tax=Clostridium manihotivorum TaxID=2320868 RepID=A0A3R5QT85_9CLOT|nr:SDR family oxidoreductase [Clostridium manihotivorum]QAA31936.1 short-chain dehydrogenase [Clostridium manihotivorum]